MDFTQRLEQLEKTKRVVSINQNIPTASPAETPTTQTLETNKVLQGLNKDFLRKVLDIHKKLIDEAKLHNLNLNVDFSNKEEVAQARANVEKELISLVERLYPDASRKEKGDLIQAVINETVGLGPLEHLVNDPSISEIMVNSYNNIYIERNGMIQEIEAIFYDNEHVKHIIQRIVSNVGRRIDESMPMVDARLKDGSRVNAIIPPLALSGPALTIRKFRDSSFDSKDLVTFGSYSPEMEEFLKLAVLSRLNVLVSGGTGSGKTTLLNVLSSFIPTTDRIITIEDSAELRLRQKHVITLEARPANIEGSGAINIRDLVKNALRMRPDRIVVGEVRGGEALDMLQAMNTGHDGSMTTAHANTPMDSILRLETLVLMSGYELPIKAIRQQISSAIDIIVQVSRMQDGSRKIISITELSGMEGEQVLSKEIFGYQQTGFNERTRKIEGSFYAAGLVPNCAKKMLERGLVVPQNLFNQ